jgi:acyl carrier protein
MVRKSNMNVRTTVSGLVKTDVAVAVASAIQQILESGGKKPADLTGSTRPLTDVDGFDSLTAIECSFLVADALGCELQHEIEYFKDQEGTSAATLDEAVDRICAEIGI